MQVVNTSSSSLESERNELQAVFNVDKGSLCTFGLNAKRLK